MVVVARRRGTKTSFACPNCGDEITLVGTKEAVELLNTTASTFQSWKEREDFPEALWDAGQGALWRKEDLLAWYEKRNASRAEDLMGKLDITLDGLPEDQRMAAIKGLMEALASKAGVHTEVA